MGRSERLRARFIPSICLLGVMLVLAFSTCLADLVPADEVLEREGAVIGRIEIENGDVFDPSIPEENHFLYRLTNRLHYETRPWVIKRQLLFKTGEPYDHRLLEESERILRANRYLSFASVEPLAYADGVVDIRVHTVDVWTLDPRLGFSRSGGSNSTTVGIRESNLLGRGIYFALYARTNVDRDSTEFKLSDPNLRGTWYKGGLVYQDNSDGKKAEINLGKPFYALDATDANGVFWLDEDRIDSLYDRGEIQSQFRHEISRFDMFYGWSSGLVDSHTQRFSVGAAYAEDHFSESPEQEYPVLVMPGDRKFVYPYFKWERVQDRYEEARNHDQIGLVEDRYLGTHVSARIGYASEALGSLYDAWLIEASASKGWGQSGADSLLADLGFHTRIESGGVRNLQLDYSGIYHHRHDYGGLLHLALSGSLGRHLDIDNPLLLGGDSGLRGYPLRYQGGQSNMLLTLEERWYSNWFPFNLIHVGAAAFFDVGRTWGENPVGPENLGWLKDVGIGLRIGNVRSGLGSVLHIDLAFPLDGGEDIDNYQLVVEGKTSF